MKGENKQTFLLLFVSLSNILFSILINMVLSRSLGPVDYGNYSYIIGLFTFSQTIFSFGVLHSGARLISIASSNCNVRKLFGAELIILFFLYLIMTTSLYIYAFNSDNVREKQLLDVLLYIIPFGGVYLLTNYYELLLQADNKIVDLAQTRFFPRLLFCLLLFFLFSLTDITLLMALLLCLLTYLLSHLAAMIRIKPKFGKLKSTLRAIFKANREFGLNIYTGSLFSIGAAQITVLIISAFSDTNIEVGYFNLATQIAMPLTLLPGIIATVMFKQFANEPRIQKRLVIRMLTISLVCLIALLAASKLIIVVVFGEDYLDAVPLLQFLAIGVFLYGIADFFCKFLLANGRGKEIRNSAILVGFTLIASNLILIHFFNGLGAAYARILSGGIYLLLIYGYYKRFITLQTKKQS